MTQEGEETEMYIYLCGFRILSYTIFKTQKTQVFSCFAELFFQFTQVADKTSIKLMQQENTLNFLYLF